MQLNSLKGFPESILTSNWKGKIWLAGYNEALETIGNLEVVIDEKNVVDLLFDPSELSYDMDSMTMFLDEEAELDKCRNIAKTIANATGVIKVKEVKCSNG